MDDRHGSIRLSILFPSKFKDSRVLKPANRPQGSDEHKNFKQKRCSYAPKFWNAKIKLQRKKNMLKVKKGAIPSIES